MTEEIKEEKKCNCCISPEYKQFLLTILAAFLGCLVALCLYNAARKPQLPPMPMPYYGQPCPIQKMHKFDRGFQHHKLHQGKFHKPQFAPDRIKREQVPPIKPNKD